MKVSILSPLVFYARGVLLLVTGSAPITGTTGAFVAGPSASALLVSEAIGSRDRREKVSSKGTDIASGVEDKTKATNTIKHYLLYAIEKSGEKDETQSYYFQHNHDF